MRMLVFFDLPTETSSDRRNYRRFRRFLVKNGFCKRVKKSLKVAQRKVFVYDKTLHLVEHRGMSSVVVTAENSAGRYDFKRRL